MSGRGARRGRGKLNPSGGEQKQLVRLIRSIEGTRVERPRYVIDEGGNEEAATALATCSWWCFHHSYACVCSALPDG